MPNVKTDDARVALRALFTDAARVAADGNVLVSRAEESTLPPFLRTASADLRTELGTGARIRVDRLVDKAGARADEIWARFNPPGTADGRYLSKSETQEVASVDASLGDFTFRAYERVRTGGAPAPVTAPIEITAITLESTHPGVRLYREGDRFVLESRRDGTFDPFGSFRTAELVFDGVRVALTANPDRLFPAYQMQDSLPPGYGFDDLSSERQGDVLRSFFRIYKDPPGALTRSEARALATAELLRYTRDVRLQEADWQSSGLPTTWPEAVERGILDDIARFGDFLPDEGEIVSRVDEIVFSGRGPLGLYTDVHVSKSERKVTRVYIEID